MSNIPGLEKRVIFGGPDCYPWRPVFAWFPVYTVSQRWIWLRRVYKRRYWVIWGSTGFHMDPEVEYGDIFDVMTREYAQE